MSLTSALSVSLSGMNAAARRLETSAGNVANVGAVGTLSADGGSATVRPAQTVVQSSVAGGGVATSVVARSPGWEARVDPTSPFANADGLVAVPAVDLAVEAVDQIGARLAYEASAKAMKVASDMMKKAADTLA